MTQQSHFGYKTKGNKNQDFTEIFTPIFIVLLWIIAKIWEQPMCLSMDEGIKKTWYINTHTHTHTHALQSCLTLCDPTDCSLPGSSVLGILQTRILEWVAVPSAPGFSWPRYWTHLLCLLHWQAGSLPLAPPRKPACVCTHTVCVY